IVGDGAISYVVSDIMVASTHQGLGIGKRIMSEIDKYFETNTDKDAYIILLANKPANKLYEQYKFEDSSPKSIGMKRNQLK
ncbi:MAG: GNAT family N-acetyltransferase, partial [Erysipelotrichales bacterium]